jgi:signal transduction histidine kinase
MHVMSEFPIPALRDIRTRSRIKKFLNLAALSGAAIALQHAPIPLGANMELLIGSVFAWWACRIHGVPWGIALGFASAGQTYFLWGHGFGALAMGLEIPASLLIRWLLLTRIRESRSRQYRSPSIARLRALTTALYWLVAGMPLVFFTYGAGLGMPFEDQVSVGVKQSLNGIANVMLADGLYVLSGFFVPRVRGLIARRFSSATIFLYLAGLALAVLVYAVATVGGGMFARTSIGVLDKEFDVVAEAYAFVMRRHALDAQEKLASAIDLGSDTLDGFPAAGLVFQRDGAGEWQLERGDLAGEDLVLVRQGVAEKRFVVATSEGLLVLAKFGAFMAGRYVHRNEINQGLLRNLSSMLFGYRMEMEHQADSSEYWRQLRSPNGELWLVTPKSVSSRMAGWREGTFVHLSDANDWLYGRLTVSASTEEYLDMMRGYQFGLLLTLLLTMCATGILLVIFAGFFGRQSEVLRDSVDGDVHLGGSYLTAESRALLLELQKVKRRWRFAAQAAQQNAALITKIAEASHALFVVFRLPDEVIYSNLRPATFVDAISHRLLSEIRSQSPEHDEGREYWRLQHVVHREDGSVTNISWTVAEETDGLLVATGFDVTEELEELQVKAQESKLLSMGELAAGFAHEINQPLNIIKMSCSNLKRRLIKGGAEEGLVDKANRIDAQVDRASQFVLNLRRLAKAQPHTIKPVALKDLVCSIGALIKNQFALHGVRLAIELEEDLVVLGDQSLLDQVLLNLLTNAQESVVRRLGESLLPEGMIFVRATRDDDKTISLTVEDNGEGLPQGNVDLIFEPFFSTKDAGTGLGLSLSKRIVEALGGRLTAEAIDGGARFRITLKEASVPVLV